MRIIMQFFSHFIEKLHLIYMIRYEDALWRSQGEMQKNALFAAPAATQDNASSTVVNVHNNHIIVVFNFI